MPEYASWSWSPCRKPIWTPPDIDPVNKLLTVVSWDAGYRNPRWLDLSFECLARQKDRDKFDFIHIEWGSEPSPTVLNYDFITVICMNLPLDFSALPCFDTGLQWNMGMYLAATPYVMFFHNDIITADQLRIIQKKIESHPDHRYFEGHEVNRNGLQEPAHRKEFERLLNELGPDFINLPTNYQGAWRSPASVNANLLTIHKATLNEEFGGWFWNFKPQSEIWPGPGMKQDLYGGIGLRVRMQRLRLTLLKQPDMGVFGIPHGKRHNRRVQRHLEFRGVIKHWAEFIKDWIPQHPYTVAAGPRSKIG